MTVISIIRSLARELRSVFRRLARRSGSVSSAVVSFATGPDGLHVRLHRCDVPAEFHEEGPHFAEELAIPLEALADFEGRNGDVVTLEKTATNTVLVKWQDGAVPQVKEFEAIDLSALPAAPTRAEKTSPCEPGFWKALADADQSAARDVSRFAITKVQLRGSAGEIVATDGKQLLVQNGFLFPWSETALISAPVVGCRELPSDGPFTISKSDTHVSLTAGRWTLHFPIDKEGRFPEVRQVIPSLTNATTCQIDARDGRFLREALPRLPGAEDENSPVTLDLGGDVTIRAKAADQGRLTQLVLAGSRYTGKAARFACNRHHLERALALGFNQVFVVNADTPVVFVDDHRKFVVMPLGKGAVLEPSGDATVISSTGEVQQNGRSDEPVKEVNKPVVPAAPAASASNSNTEKVMASRNGQRAPTRKPAAAGINGLLDEAQAIKNELRGTFARMNQLIAAIKRHRKQNRLVASTIESLRQLKKVGA